MQRVPRRDLALVSTGPRVVIPKTVDDVIPDWPEHLDEDALPQWDPDVVDHQGTKPEVLDGNCIARLPNRLRVFFKTVSKRLAA